MKINKRYKIFSDLMSVCLALSITFYALYLFLRDSFLTRTLGWLPFQIAIGITIIASLMGVYSWKGYYKRFKGMKDIDIGSGTILLSELVGLGIILISLCILNLSIIYRWVNSAEMITMFIVFVLLLSLLCLWKLFRLTRIIGEMRDESATKG